ncbi:MAG TPA: citramalate synthase [Methanomassiliicoccales archaeon]|nr:citramalate synthase [Methanomassiliicoccales archaeon]
MPTRASIFDTTLRDGSQTEGVSFSTEDKLEILDRLDAFGIDFIEGGYPGSNPKDKAFFKAAKSVKLKNGKLVAFGSTHRPGHSPEQDQNLKALLDTETEWVCIFGKSWDLHTEKALQVSLEENLNIVHDTVAFMKENGRRVIFDAEHFFDGYKNNQKYAFQVLDEAKKAGAEWFCLCDTNGGAFPSEVFQIVSHVRQEMKVPLGIHAHNDGELAVGNSLAAVEAGASMVQGTMNGLGERCGNANLCSVIPNLMLKMGVQTGVQHLDRLTGLANFVAEMANIAPNPRAPYVGRSAFAHKGGIHVSAVLKDSRTYEHVDPALIGNLRRILVSELSGVSNIMAKAEELGIDTERDGGRSILEKMKALEAQGFQYEAADASLELLIRKLKGQNTSPFRLDGFRTFMDVTGDVMTSEASVRVVDSDGTLEHTAANGNGPVNALDRALRKALERFYPVLKEMRLIDYKVRVIDGKEATAAKVRVLISSTDGTQTWTTIGVSENIIEASLMALIDSIEYKLMKAGISGNDVTLNCE